MLRRLQSSETSRSPAKQNEIVTVLQDKTSSFWQKKILNKPDKHLNF